MGKIYWIRNVPEIVSKYFEQRFPNCTYKFYYYYPQDNKAQDKFYACEVSKDGKLFDNSLQAPLHWFISQKSGKIMGICGHPLSGLAHLIIQGDGFGEVVHLESGYGLRQIANAFGSLEDAIGKSITYNTDFLSVLEGFSPVDGGA